MHRNIGNHDEGTREDGKPYHVSPERADVEAESTQDRCTRHFDV